MAEKKEVVDEAFPGDVVGLYDSGNFKIGDTLTEGEELHFRGIPQFSPEQFRIVQNEDPMKSKQLAKGLAQLMDEGVVQMFTREFDGRRIIGTVGALQFEIIAYRLEHEYGAKVSYEPVSMFKAFWLGEESDAKALRELRERRKANLALDTEGRLVYLAESPWMLKMAQDQHAGVVWRDTSE